VRALPRLADIAGQPHVLARLRAAIAGDRVHHAYLMTCSDARTSTAVALALAGALNCQRAEGEGCAGGSDTACDACSKIDQGIHPDVITVAREGAAQLVPIETVRAQIVARVAAAPHEARVRVFLFDEATALAGPAANALLKTLEEPPARTMFVLCTVAPEQLLPTIRSRCQRLAFGPVDSARLAVGDDAEAAARIGALAEAVAGFDTPAGALDLAAQIAAGKGEAPTVMAAASEALHRRARVAADRGELAAAVAWARRGEVLARWKLAVATHNAHPQIAMEAILGELAQLPPPSWSEPA
jgi:DNA polymerase-3 subunit delta'